MTVQLRDLEEINLALRGEFGSSGIVDNNTLPYQYDTFQDNLVNVAGFQVCHYSIFIQLAICFSNPKLKLQKLFSHPPKLQN